MQNNSTFSNEDRLRLIEMRFKYEISTCPEAKGDGGECGDGSKCTWCRAVAENSVEMLPEASVAMITAEGFAREVDEVLGLTGPATGLDAKVLATLRFYEEKIANFVKIGLQDITDIQNLKEEIRNLGAEVERLTTALKLAQFDADNYQKMFEREAPFAALGRGHIRYSFSTDPMSFNDLEDLTLSARVAHSGELKSQWSKSAPSGKCYRVIDGRLMARWISSPTVPGRAVDTIPVEDADFVGELMKTPKWSP